MITINFSQKNICISFHLKINHSNRKLDLIKAGDVTSSCKAVAIKFTPVHKLGVKCIIKIIN